MTARTPQCRSASSSLSASLIALNEHVGLCLGTELSIAVGEAPVITLPIGHLGVNAYF